MQSASTLIACANDLTPGAQGYLAGRRVRRRGLLPFFEQGQRLVPLQLHHASGQVAIEAAQQAVGQPRPPGGTPEGPETRGDDLQPGNVRVGAGGAAAGEDPQVLAAGDDVVGVEQVLANAVGLEGSEQFLGRVRVAGGFESGSILPAASRRVVA